MARHGGGVDRAGVLTRGRVVRVFRAALLGQPCRRRRRLQRLWSGAVVGVDDGDGRLDPLLHGGRGADAAHRVVQRRHRRRHLHRVRRRHLHRRAEVGDSAAHLIRVAGLVSASQHEKHEK